MYPEGIRKSQESFKVPVYVSHVNSPARQRERESEGTLDVSMHMSQDGVLEHGGSRSTLRNLPDEHSSSY